jgi:hypothetical protein
MSAIREASAMIVMAPEAVVTEYLCGPPTSIRRRVVQMSRMTVDTNTPWNGRMSWSDLEGLARVIT